MIMPNMGTIRHKAKASTSRARRLDRVGLSDALFTTTQQRVLRLLYGQPERSFFASELIALSRAGSGAVQRELARLADSGLITTRTIGRQRHFQANVDAPIFEELRNIVLKTFGAADPLRTALQPLRDRIKQAAIYGSVAKGKDRASSDIDLLVVSDALMLEDLFDALEPVERMLGRKVNPTLINSRELAAKASNPFLEKVLAGPTVPLIGEDALLGGRHEAAG